MGGRGVSAWVDGWGGGLGRGVQEGGATLGVLVRKGHRACL